jgi:diadenosine tetraphosphate (Ap4A) HIT family hydrolase
VRPTTQVFLAKGKDVPMVDECYACRGATQLGSLPPREAVFIENGWRVAHAINSALEGWLVVVPLRHVTSMDELTPTEAMDLGSILRRASLALTNVVGSTKAYFMFFAEKEGFSHFHVHVVPRMPWFTKEQSGPRVFTLMGGPESAWVPERAQDELALRLREAFAILS